MNKTYNLLSIYINTKGFGYAVLNDESDLIDYGMVGIRPVNNKKSLKKIQDIIQKHEPELILLRDNKSMKRSSRIILLNKQISAFIRYSSKVKHYSRKQIQQTFEKLDAKNKFEIAKTIGKAYPHLQSRVPSKRKIWESENYYQGLFDAISLIYTHYFSEK